MWLGSRLAGSIKRQMDFEGGMEGKAVLCQIRVTEHDYLNLNKQKQIYENKN